ncbi:zinc finger MYM-type 1 [Labeo rohita]|uniref:Zinc finger MYM-type 1 n=1 Tax=Labeo rohita TaxID=84645 RepID=A0A498MNJ9_LABRO|nr:zinc finger MYM-type 1 [Labeo rohita]
MFSGQLDTTQDITGKNQCSVILRYVTDAVHERLVAVVQCNLTTGQSFVTLLTEVLEHLKLDIGLCIGNSTDGASNMQGQYRGFSALMADKYPTHQHVWCYAHVLNLVLSDTTHSVIESGSLFDLLNDIAVFIRESYTRVGVWETESQDKRHKRISPIGETRWWAKHDALRKVFGNYGRPHDGLFVEVVSTLSAIMNLKTLATNERSKAKGYRDGLLRYETVLTAQLFLRIFEFTSPLSKYLQTSGMDILSAHRMVTTTHESLKKIARDFPAVKDAADCFVHWANEKLEEHEELDLEVEAALSQNRVKRKKVLAGEMAPDESLSDAEKAYEVNVHHQILYTAVEAMHQRFFTHGTLYADLSLLHPRNFPLIKTSALPESSLEELSKCLVVYDSRATVFNLQIELRNLAQQWDRLSTKGHAAFCLRILSGMGL